jgi:hypothetical protein
MDGMKLSPRGQFTWSVVFFLIPGPFSSHACFFLALTFFMGRFIFLSLFSFRPTILEPNFFLGELLPTPPTYLPLQPTYLPSTTEPIYLPLPTPPPICAPLHH